MSRAALQKQIPDSKVRKSIIRCLNSMREWGIEVKGDIHWSMRKIESFGRTTSISGGQFIRITLNRGLATQPRAVIEDTIYHELAHVVAGVQHGHDKEWKKVIRIIRDHTNLPLREKGEITDVSNEFWFTGFRYVLCCQKCRQMIGFNIKNEIVKNPGEWDSEHNCQRFTHKGCGGTWMRIK